jgi:hypothetical protein
MLDLKTKIEGICLDGRFFVSKYVYTIVLLLPVQNIIDGRDEL